MKKTIHRENLRPRWLYGELYHPFKEEITSFLHKLFQKMEDQGILFNLFCGAIIFLIQNQRHHMQKSYRTVCLRI